ncbi:MAG: class I SAM-dependent methyltransferase [Nitrospirales bacterium]
MPQQKTPPLSDKYAAVDFYQGRYARGYMEQWPIEKEQKIIQVIRNLELPEVGEALDFGCGNGVGTEIIRQALPSGWKVYGTDISDIAIKNAKERYPGCIFFVEGDRGFTDKRFDFLFTNHVLEHVYNLPHVLGEINDYLKDESTTLQILPCGNKCSFEHNICCLRKDGIDPQVGNRFFYEDPGHLRRLNTDQLSALFNEKNFILVKEYYRNQYYGAINWITQTGPGFILLFTNTSSALDEKAKWKLRIWRSKLLLLWASRYPANCVERKLRKWRRTARDYILLTLTLPFYVFTKPMDFYLKAKALDEWNKKKTERSGSEMYLFFKRSKRG